MSVRRTFSTGLGASRRRNYRELLDAQHRTASIASHAHQVFCAARDVFDRHVGTDLTSARILEIGAGQRFPVTLLFHTSGAECIGIDMDELTPLLSLWGAYRTWRRNGAERALKTAVRQLLFDHSYFQALAAAYGAPLRFNSLRLMAMDACVLEFPDETFDFVFSHNVFEHIYDVGQATREMTRVLRPGGVACVGICLFPSLSGGHQPEWERPDEELPRSIPPWDHLRGNVFPPSTYLNGLREADYLRIFRQSLDVIEIESHYQGARHLTPALRKELSNYSEEDLLKDFVRLVLRKPNRQ